MPGEYKSLYEYLEHRYANTVVLTFAQIEDLLGFTLPLMVAGERRHSGLTSAGVSSAHAQGSCPGVLARRRWDRMCPALD